ncbi:hypothetical protein BOH66_04705 [Microbacterium aurum]|uniref:Uncharacterized protein n=1 Tax=Microbacterium aurum TaxID=36805 RepID=A0A1P8U6D6_9MICO|nr:hypothetical protein [Microbacterium aurum]APZ33644.1 hypothetical protein BOH66_04705 [Microbacterium aurum]MBM7827352.1 hypothetical protein [Microbacterium aurum]
MSGTEFASTRVRTDEAGRVVVGDHAEAVRIAQDAVTFRRGMLRLSVAFPPVVAPGRAPAAA